MELSKTQKMSEPLEQEGFGIVEVIVSVFLLGLLGVVIAGGLAQSIIANSRNVFYASVSQLMTKTTARIQSEVSNCTELMALVNESLPSDVVDIDNRVVEIKTSPLNWTTCNPLLTKIYPLKIISQSEGVTVFSLESLVVID